VITVIWVLVDAFLIPGWVRNQNNLPLPFIEITCFFTLRADLPTPGSTLCARSAAGGGEAAARVPAMDRPTAAPRLCLGPTLNRSPPPIRLATRQPGSIRSPLPIL
jgi:hypothetical protein